MTHQTENKLLKNKLNAETFFVFKPKMLSIHYLENIPSADS